MDTSILLAWLCSKIHLNSERLNTIFGKYESLEHAIKDSSNQLSSSKWLEKYIVTKNWRREIAQFQEILYKHDTKIITIYDFHYPQKLKIIDNYPLVLYYQGNYELLNNIHMLTVVGSRNYARYSEIVMNQVSETVCQQGVGVVSGLAMGIDGLSH